MSFDFSLYDESDNSPIQVSKSIKSNDEVETPSFDFSLYDEPSSTINSSSNNNSSKKDPIYQQYAVKQKTPEELKKMNFSERLDYANELNREREYLSSAGFTKGALSGASFGATENIDSLKPQEYESNTGLGMTLGSFAPIGLISKAVSIPIKAYQRAAQLPNYIGEAAQTFSTGAGFSSGKEAVKALSGEETNLYEIPKTGAEFAALHSLFGVGKTLFDKFSKLSIPAQSSIIEKQIIPENLPKSQYDTASEMLSLLQKQEQKSPPRISVPEINVRAPAKSLHGRISEKRLNEIGLRPISESPRNQNLTEKTGNIFSKNRFYNTTQGGQGIKQNVIQQDEKIYKDVNQKYQKSRELNKQVSDIQPELVDDLESKIRDLQEIPEPSDVQKRVIKTSKNIMKKLVSRDKEGNITGYLPVNNQTLIDQIQSLRQIIDYDFSHGNTKNIFRPLINNLQEAVYQTAERSGATEASKAFSEARNAYRNWAETFDNPYIRPFRDKSNKDFSKLYKSSVDTDEFNVLNSILSETPEGSNISQALRRDIVEKKLSPFLENSQKANPKEFDTAVRELEAVISPEEADQVRNIFNDARKTTKPIRATAPPKKQLTNDQLIASRFTGKSPEDIQSMMNSRSGIRQLRKDSANDPIKQQVFDRLTKQKMRSILREGNIESDFKGNELYKLLNKEKNFELFSEILGESETEQLRQAAKDIGEKSAKSEFTKQMVTKVGQKVAAYKTLQLIFGLF